MRLKSPDGAVIADPVRRVALCFDSVSAGFPDRRNDQRPAVSRRAAMVRTQGADRCAGYASNSHLIDPAMIPVRGELPSRPFRPLSRRPPFQLKRQTLIHEPMSYRLLLQHKQHRPNVYLFRMSLNSVKIK